MFKGNLPSFVYSILIVLVMQVFNANYTFDLARLEFVIVQFLILHSSFIFSRYILNNFFHNPTQNIFESYIVGYLSLSTVLIPFVFLLKLDVTLLLEIALFAILIISFFLFKFVSWNINHFNNLNLKIILLALGVTSIYSFSQLSSFQDVLKNGGNLPLHVDLLFQGGTLEQIATGDQFGQKYFRDIPGIFYHYAIFMIPAGLVDFFNIRGIDILIFWSIPLGLFFLILAIYDFGFNFIKDKNYAIILLLLILIPDASRYIFNGLYDVHYLLLASPGSIYGLALSLIIIKNMLIVMDEYRLTSIINKKLILYVFFLLFILFNVRFHFFALLLIYAGLSIISFRFNVSKLKTFLLVYILAWLFANFEFFYQTALADFLKFNLTFIHPVFLRKLFQTTIHIPSISYFLILLFASGFLFYSLVDSGKRFINTESNSSIVLMPTTLAFAYLILLTIAPMPHYGDSTEFTQRPFLIIYFIFLMYAFLSFKINYFSPSKFAGLILILFLLSSSLDRSYGQPINHIWHQGSFNVNLDQNLIRLSEYVRNQTKSGDTFLYLPQSAEDFSLSESIQISSLSGCYSYMSRPGHYLTEKNAKINKVVYERLLLSDSLKQFGFSQKITEVLQKEKIKWVVFKNSKFRLNNNSNQVEFIYFGNYTLAKIV